MAWASAAPKGLGDSTEKRGDVSSKSTPHNSASSPKIASPTDVPSITTAAPPADQSASRMAGVKGWVTRPLSRPDSVAYPPGAADSFESIRLEALQRTRDASQPTPLASSPATQLSTTPSSPTFLRASPKAPSSLFNSAGASSPATSSALADEVSKLKLQPTYTVTSAPRDRLASVAGDFEKERDMALDKKEGWLTKVNKRNKQQERYIRLFGTSLSWSKTPTDKMPLGGIDLQSASAPEPLSEQAFVIHATKKGIRKEFRFVAPNPPEAREWREAIIRSKKKKFYQMGWASRKKKPLWLLLKGDTLYTFLREQDPYSDFRKNINFGIMLYECELVHVDQLNIEIIDKKVKPPHSHPFTFRTPEESTEWRLVLQQTISAHSTRVATSRSEKFGYVKKKGKRRFLVLADGRLTWYLSAEDATEKGSLMLEHSQVGADPNEQFGFVVYNVHDRSNSYTFIASDLEDLGAWASAVQRAIERAKAKRDMQVDEMRAAAVNNRERVAKSGWTMMKGKRRWVQLKDGLLMWFADDRPHAEMEGNLYLLECVVTREEYNCLLRTAKGKVITMAFQTKEEATDWTTAIAAAVQQIKGLLYAQKHGRAVEPRLALMEKLMSAGSSKRGEVKQKMKPRTLELQPGQLVVYDSTDNSLLKMLPLEGCNVNLFARESFLLRTWTKSYVFDCASPKEAQDWVEVLAVYIIKANEAAENGLEIRGWVVVNEKYRWLALQKGALYAFKQSVSFELINDATARLFLPLYDCKLSKRTTEKLNVIDVVGRNRSKAVKGVDSGAGAPTKGSTFHRRAVEALKKGSQLVRGNVDKQKDKESEEERYELCFEDDEEFSKWWEKLSTAASKPAPVVRPRVPLVGSALADIPGGASDVPTLLVTLLTYLRKRIAAGAKGLFQGQVNFTRVRDMIDKLNAGEPIDYDKYQLVDVCGLVKQFFRHLPEPLMTFALYDSFISTGGDWRQLKTVIKQLPPPNYRTLSHLVGFLVDLQASQDVGVLAMTFTPLLLRRAAQEQDEQLLSAVEVLRTLIRAYRPIFFDEEATEETAAMADMDVLLRRLMEGKDLVPAGSLSHSRSQTNANAVSSLDSLFEELQQEKHATMMATASRAEPRKTWTATKAKAALKEVMQNSKEHQRLMEQLVRDNRTIATGVTELDDLLGELKAEKEKELITRKSTRKSGRVPGTSPLTSPRSISGTIVSSGPPPPPSEDLLAIDSLLGKYAQEKAAKEQAEMRAIEEERLRRVEAAKLRAVHSRTPERSTEGGFAAPPLHIDTSRAQQITSTSPPSLSPTSLSPSHHQRQQIRLSIGHRSPLRQDESPQAAGTMSPKATSPRQFLTSSGSSFLQASPRNRPDSIQGAPLMPTPAQPPRSVSPKLAGGRALSPSKETGTQHHAYDAEGELARLRQERAQMERDRQEIEQRRAQIERERIQMERERAERAARAAALAATAPSLWSSAPQSHGEERDRDRLHASPGARASRSGSERTEGGRPSSVRKLPVNTPIPPPIVSPIERTNSEPTASSPAASQPLPVFSQRGQSTLKHLQAISAAEKEVQDLLNSFPGGGGGGTSNQ